ISRRGDLRDCWVSLDMLVLLKTLIRFPIVHLSTTASGRQCAVMWIGTNFLSLCELFQQFLRISEYCTVFGNSLMNKQHNLRTFYTLILTQVFSLIGSQISGFAISIWVYQQTGDATPLALVSFFFIVPQVLAAGLSGVLADRWDRRYVMMLADTGQAVGTVLLLISFASGQFQLWHLYAVTFLQSLFNIFQGPSFQASVTMLVPDEQRDRAN